MTSLVVETRIAAPIEFCFDLARDVDVHVATSTATAERVVGGRTSGLLDLGDEVTFEAVHFGFRQRLTSRVVELDPPIRFVDEMVRGPFRSFRHAHDFVAEGPSVLMRDTLIWVSPLGFLGVCADRLFVERHLRAYMTAKQWRLKEHAQRLASGVDSLQGPGA